MSSAPKLTKKQKKALAFRDRGKGKGKHKAKSFDELDNDIPVEEDQDRADAALYLAEEAAGLEAQAGLPKHAKKGGAQTEGEFEHQGQQGERKAKKRKQEEQDVEVVKGLDEEDEGATAGAKAKKKRKGEDGAAVDGEDGVDRNARKQKFILFVGNLKYTTTKEAVEQHFSKCDPPPTVRLMTPKPSAISKPTTKSKGFAFVEFSHQNALQQGLKLHHSELEGRKINVELTAGGGGNSDRRLEKVKQRNKELYNQRKAQVLKRSSTKKKWNSEGAEGEGEGEEEVRMERPQRYSATSGVDQVVLKKRTWSVPENDDEAPAAKKRGSKKGKKRPPKPLGTGMNAIPVG